MCFLQYDLTSSFILLQRHVSLWRLQRVCCRNRYLPTMSSSLLLICLIHRIALRFQTLLPFWRRRWCRKFCRQRFFIEISTDENEIVEESMIWLTLDDWFNKNLLSIALSDSCHSVVSQLKLQLLRQLIVSPVPHSSTIRQTVIRDVERLDSVCRSRILLSKWNVKSPILVCLPPSGHPALPSESVFLVRSSVHPSHSRDVDSTSSFAFVSFLRTRNHCMFVREFTRKWSSDSMISATLRWYCRIASRVKSHKKYIRQISDCR